MGCGASTANSSGDGKSAKGKYQTSDRSHTSGYADPQQRSDDADDIDDDEPLVPPTEEELRLIAEMDKRSSCSTAVSAEEPGNFRLNVRVGMRVMKARVLHGIDGDCEDADTLAAKSTRPDSEAQRRPYGDLKPKQVRKIHDWAQKVLLAHGNDPSNFEPVPERYLSRHGHASSPNLSASRHASQIAINTSTDGHSEGSMLSPRTPSGSTAYPPTPHRFPASSRGGDDTDSRLGDMSVSDCTPRDPRSNLPGFFDDEGESPREGGLPRGDDMDTW